MAQRFGLVQSTTDLLPWPLKGFDKLLRLLILTQDFYLPEVRSDLRSGLVQSYSCPILSGTFFTANESYVLGALRAHRERLIEEGHFKPQDALSEVGMTSADLTHWADSVRVMATTIDPLEKWRDLVRFVSRTKRQELKGAALVAQDFYEMLDHIALLASDLGIDIGEATLLQWQDPDFSTADPSRDEWRLSEYGRKALGNSNELLEFLANEFGVNPKPRAVILTEGEECHALGSLYEAIGAPPTQLGIEFRSLGGHGNFSVSNWQCFVEYMHKKQVLVYFVLDREGRAEREVTRMLAAKRRFDAPGLKQVIPAKDRIEVWKSSFEEANFTDKQIADALCSQGVQVSYQKVGAMRGRQRTKALINALSEELEAIIDKPRLARDLVEKLISVIRSGRKRVPTPLEEFVEKSARLIALNHQPISQDSVSRNRATGLLG